MSTSPVSQENINPILGSPVFPKKSDKSKKVARVILQSLENQNLLQIQTAQAACPSPNTLLRQKSNKEVVGQCLNKGKALMEQGQIDNAFHQFNAGLELSIIDPELKAELFFNIALIYRLQNNDSSAIYLQEAISLEHANHDLKAKILLHLGNYYFDKGDWKMSLCQWDEGIRISEFNHFWKAKFYLNKVKLFIQQGEYTEAIIHLDRTSDLAVESPELRAEILFYRGCVCYCQQQPQALEYWQKAYSISHTNNELMANILLHMAVFFAQVGNHNEAFLHLKEGIKLEHSNEELKAKLFLNLGSLLHLQGNMKHAGECWNLAFRQKHYNKDLKGEILLKIGFYFEHNQKFEEAIKAWEAAIDLVPTNPKFMGFLHFNIGRCFRIIENYDEAIESLKNALEFIDNDDQKSAILDQLAWTYRDNGEMQKALIELEKKIRLLYPNQKQELFDWIKSLNQ